MSVYTASDWAPAGATGGALQPPYYATFMRENLYGNLFWRQIGTLVTIPRGHGTKAKISRWDTPIIISAGRMKIDTAVQAITMQGDATAGLQVKGLSAHSIEGEVTGWAGGRGYTDKMVIVSMANFIEGALESLSRELGFRLDAYCRAKVSANAFSHKAVAKDGTKPAGNVPTANVLNGKNVARVKPLMGANGCPTWDDGTYVGIAHEFTAHDMFTDVSATGFISVARYNDARQIYRGEMGEFYGVRWLFSNASPRIYGANGNTAQYGISVGATGGNAYIFAPDAFYNLELETGGVEVIHQPLGSAGVADAAAQLGSVAVKVFFGVLPAPSTDRRVMIFRHGMPLGY